MITSENRMLLSRQVYRTSLRRLLKDVTCCSDTWPDWTPPLQRIRSWSKSLLSSQDTSPTLSGGELLDVLVTLGSCRLAMDHHWVSDGSGRRHRITVIMDLSCLRVMMMMIFGSSEMTVVKSQLLTILQWYILERVKNNDKMSSSQTAAMD